MAGLRITYPENKGCIISVPMNGFPKKVWDEWDADCKKNYGDIRWSKAWTDHLKSKLYDQLMEKKEKGELDGKVC